MADRLGQQEPLVLRIDLTNGVSDRANELEILGSQFTKKTVQRSGRLVERELGFWVSAACTVGSRHFELESRLWIQKLVILTHQLVDFVSQPRLRPLTRTRKC